MAKKNKTTKVVNQPKPKSKTPQKIGLILIFIALIGIIYLVGVAGQNQSECINDVATNLCDQYELNLDSYEIDSGYVNCIAPYDQIITIKANMTECNEMGLFDKYD